MRDGTTVPPCIPKKILDRRARKLKMMNEAKGHNTPITPNVNTICSNGIKYYNIDIYLNT